MVKQEMTKKERQSFYLDVELAGTTATYSEGILTVKGTKGEVSKVLRYPYVNVKVEEGKISVGTERFTKKEKKIIFTFAAHVRNLIKGVTEGFTYKLVVVYAKFPMTVALNGTTFSVKNLLGEKVPRTFEVPSDVTIKIAGKDITVEGIDKEKTGQVAANIEQLCRITHLDRRVVQDGIFITEKPHRVYE